MVTDKFVRTRDLFDLLLCRVPRIKSFKITGACRKKNLGHERPVLKTVTFGCLHAEKRIMQ